MRVSNSSLDGFPGVKFKFDVNPARSKLLSESESKIFRTMPSEKLPQSP